MDSILLFLIIALLINIILVFIIIKQKIKINHLEYEYERSQNTGRGSNLFNRQEDLNNRNTLNQNTLRNQSRANVSHTSGIHLTDDVMNDLIRLIEKKEMISAVKLVREHSKVGLKEAKDYVFGLRDK